MESGRRPAAPKSMRAAHRPSIKVPTNNGDKSAAVEAIAEEEDATSRTGRRSRDQSLKRARSSQRPMLNLRNTLEQFGGKNFDANAYVVGEFKRVPVDKADGVYDDLRQRHHLVSECLKRSVNEHYQDFIGSAKEIQVVESDMSQLHTMLTAYRSAMTRLDEDVASIQLATQSIVEMDSGVAEGNMDDVDAPSDDGEVIAENVGMMQNGTMRAHDEASALDELSEDLEGMMYERKYEQAVSIIEAALEKMEQLDMRASAVQAARAAFQKRVDRLVYHLTESVNQTSLKSSERRRNLDFLIRLGHVDGAQDIFLARQEIEMRAAIAKINVSGDLTSYVTDLSGIVFSSLASSASEFKRLFKDRRRMSSYLRWTLDQIRHFVSVFQRQVFNVESPFRSVCQSIHLAMLASQMLRRNGLELSFVLEKALLPDLRLALQKQTTRLQRSLSKSTKSETWESEEVWVTKLSENFTHSTTPSHSLDVILTRHRDVRPSVKLVLTKSLRYVYDVLQQLIGHVKLVTVSSPELTHVAVASINSIVEYYLVKMTEASKSGSLQDGQGIAIVANSFYLAEDLYGRLRNLLFAPTALHSEDSAIDSQNNRNESQAVQQGTESSVSTAELDAFQGQIAKFFKAQRDFFAQKRGSVWIEKCIGWQQDARVWYTGQGVSQQHSATRPYLPSTGFVSFVRYVSSLRKQIRESLDVDIARRMGSRAIAQVLSQLRDRGLIEATLQNGLRQAGLLQLTLDLAYLQASGAGPYEESSSVYARTVLSCALRCLDVRDSRQRSDDERIAEAGQMLSEPWIYEVIRGLAPTYRLEPLVNNEDEIRPRQPTDDVIEDSDIAY